MEVDETSFLPESWREAAMNGSRNGWPRPYPSLLSRGPMSHGCTHLTTGHISELRQLLPSETDQLYEAAYEPEHIQFYRLVDMYPDAEVGDSHETRCRASWAHPVGGSIP